MPSTAKCWTRKHAALAAVTTLLTACAGVGSDIAPSACPPVVAYSTTEQVKVAEEVDLLPEDTVIVAWLADYTVLRDQARTCRTSSHDQERRDHQSRAGRHRQGAPEERLKNLAY